MIQEFGSKTLENEFALRHALETEFTFGLESNLQSSNLTSRESFEQINLTRLIQEIHSKALEIQFAVRHGFETEFTF